ncbi:hypothetical protein [Loigolactobacillus backii]|uniref:hypothetical protein n=1 Tax=Loigolactobacillus backii TaxID=375175 RepID=UPI0022FD8449|nr:hypothetical protein [Loigolactobacillus backii]MDA5388286.1 hypothetical protein [Loigolactobacillus backii]MDA5390780.1 hypothetical protein [Loigolactobacillus backii]
MKRILYISLVDWFWIKQRPQHICENLSKMNYEVDYFCIRAWKQKNKVQKHSSNDSLSDNKISITDNLHIYRSHVIPKGKYPIINDINGLYLRTKINKLFSEKHYDYIVLTHPNQLLYLNANVKKQTMIIYDCMDSYQDFSMSNVSLNKLIKLEQGIVDIASQIVVSSKQIKLNLINKYDALSEKIHIINNGVDINNFNINRLNSENNKLLNANLSDGRNITYIGTISSWVDITLVIKAAKKFEKDIFYFIGPIDITLPKNIPRNVIFLGAKQYDSIPFYINDSDILLMPFKLGGVVESVNPVKLYEYLAMGKNVLAIKYSETQRFAAYVNLYSTEKQFFECLDNITAKVSNEEKKKRIAFAKNNSWQNRAESFANILK